MKRIKNKASLPPEDDGRTVAPMNVEGMPWHTVLPQTQPGTQAEPMQGKALRRYLFSAVWAGLLMTMVFGAAGALFILFCTQVWFR